MTFIGHAFVDWDDTIAENIKYFNQTEQANSQLIARLTGLDPAYVLARGQELDLAVARRIGLVKESLAIAWVECYHHCCTKVGLQPDPATEDALRYACRMPYEVKQELLPGAAETLAWLHNSGFEVTIWTAGEESVQSRKIQDSGLSHLVHRSQIVLDKTPERLTQALGDRDPSRTFVVGNSAHSDIRPALAIGLLAIHIPTETWAYDQSRLDPANPNYYKIEQITELPSALASRFRRAV